MKGYRFFAEMPDNRASKQASKKHDEFDKTHLRLLADKGLRCNLVAVLIEDGKPMYNSAGDKMDAVVRELGGFMLAQATPGWLRKRCVRVDEELARRLCPEMFNYLEEP